MDPVKFGHDSYQYVFQPPNVRDFHHQGIVPQTKPFEVNSTEKTEKSKEQKDQKVKDQKEKKKKGDEQKNAFSRQDPEKLAKVFRGEKQDSNPETNPQFPDESSPLDV